MTSVQGQRLQRSAQRQSLRPYGYRSLRLRVRLRHLCRRLEQGDCADVCGEGAHEVEFVVRGALGAYIRDVELPSDSGDRSFVVSADYGDLNATALKFSNCTL